MGEFSDKLHFVEINFPSKIGIEPEFFIKIDGKKIEGCCGAKIESRMQIGDSVSFPYPRVTISFWAKGVKGNIEGQVFKKEK